MEFLGKIKAFVTAIFMLMKHGKTDAQKIIFDEQIKLEQKIAEAKLEHQKKKNEALSMISERVSSIKKDIDICSKLFGSDSRVVRNQREKLKKWEQKKIDVMSMS